MSFFSSSLFRHQSSIAISSQAPACWDMWLNLIAPNGLRLSHMMVSLLDTGVLKGRSKEAKNIERPATVQTRIYHFLCLNLETLEKGLCAPYVIYIR